LKDAPRWQYLAAVPFTLTGSIYKMPFVSHFQTSNLTVKSEGEQEVHIDGEGMKTIGNLEFGIRPHSLHILVPQ
jgi:diacylglycerol kinase family enzyme